MAAIVSIRTINTLAGLVLDFDVTIGSEIAYVRS